MQKILITLLAAGMLASCQSPETKSENTNEMTKTVEAPIAKKDGVETTLFGDTRVDNYHWMRLSDEQKSAEIKDQQTLEVEAYLNAENDFTDGVMADTETFQSDLFEEMKGRIKEDDSSVPYKNRGFFYYTRFEVGSDYPLYCRKPESMDNLEQVMLNGPVMAEDYDYFSVAGRAVSPDNNLLAFGLDTVSRRIYTVYFKDLATGKMLDDKIEGTTGGVTWAADNKTVFYTKKDPVTLRSSQIYRHTLGTPQAEDVLVFEEKDETFSVFVYKTKSYDYIMIGSVATQSAEYRFLDAKDPNGKFKMLQERERDLEYSVAHFGDDFYIMTNKDGATNFKLMRTSVSNPGQENWKDVIGHREDVLLEGIEIFEKFLVLEERKEGLTKLRVKPWAGDAEFFLPFQDPTYTAYISTNPDFDSEILRYGYSSMTTPNSVYDFNMRSKEKTLLKQQEVIGDFDPENYTSERIYATADDGTQVPMSIVYKKGIEKNGKNPLLLYGYGSYGNSIDAYFSSVRLSLLDRGFVYVIAHIRGGQEMGRQWYEDGKKLKKINTFTDFIDCGEHLVAEGYTSNEHLYAMGGSAGGLLMGAVINMAPDMWNGVVAAVPFVDVVNTMLDETIPLTTGEFDEWGNPKEEEYYHYIKSYSPYDQVKAQTYPNLLITTGYWDSQVQYWEPAKWIAKLRDMRTNDNMLMLKTNMTAGHGGASGRFDSLKEVALEYAFLLKLEGITS